MREVIAEDDTGKVIDSMEKNLPSSLELGGAYKSYREMVRVPMMEIAGVFPGHCALGNDTKVFFIGLMISTDFLNEDHVFSEARSSTMIRMYDTFDHKKKNLVQGGSVLVTNRGTMISAERNVLRIDSPSSYMSMEIFRNMGWSNLRFYGARMSDQDEDEE